MGKRIVFTGGSGKAGRYAIAELIKRGHQVLNLDVIDFPDPSLKVLTLKTDLTDSGQVFNALTSHFGFEDYQKPNNPGLPDAVIHFAAYPRNLIVPDNVCYAANVTSTYNVIEAACKLGVPKIIIASSGTTYEVTFAQGDYDYIAFPLQEDLDVNPMDTYAISKLCGERVARGFARRFNTDIYALRIGHVFEPHEYERDFPAYLKNAQARKRDAWSYMDARDLGQICHLCVEKDGLGFQVFNATNDTILAEIPTRQFFAKYAPETPITRDMGEWESPTCNRKIREMLGFREEHDWRLYYSLKK